MPKDVLQAHMCHEQTLMDIASILRGILHAMMLHWDLVFDDNGDVKKDDNTRYKATADQIRAAVY